MRESHGTAQNETMAILSHMKLSIPGTETKHGLEISDPCLLFCKEILLNNIYNKRKYNIIISYERYKNKKATHFPLTGILQVSEFDVCSLLRVHCLTN